MTFPPPSPARFCRRFSSGTTTFRHVMDTSVVARKGNSASYEPSFTEPLHAGTEFNILEERSDWVHVELMDGHRSWLPNMAIERVRLPGPGASPLLTEK